MELSRRIKLGWFAFGKLGFILRNKNIPLHLKKKIFEVCILPVLTYGLETMSLTKRSAQRLQVTQRAMERSMLGVSLRDKIRNETLRSKTKLTDVMHRVAKLKWQWTGHVARQNIDRWPNKITNWRPWGRKRKIGRPQKRWKDDIREISGRNWVGVAQDRDQWKLLEEYYIQKWMT